MTGSRKAVALPSSSAGSTPLSSWWILAVTLLIVQRPLAAPDLWWTLAKGRAVAAGSLAPSQHLLLLDTSAEADWLGGLPFYLTWSLGGLHALAAVPLVSSIVLLLFFIRPMALVVDRRLILILLPFLLLLLRHGLQPVPQLFDLAGMCLLWRLNSRGQSVGRGLAVFLLFIVWANSAPLPIWGILYLLMAITRVTSAVSSPHASTRGHQECVTLSFPWMLLAAALVGGSLTPRGILSWRDSFILFAAGAFEATGIDSGSRLDLAFQQQKFLAPDLLLLWFLCAGCCTVRLWQWWRDTGRDSRPDWAPRGLYVIRQIGLFGVPAIAGLLNRDNIPLASIWLLLQLAERQWTVSAAFQSARWTLTASSLTGFLIVVEALGLGFSPFSRIGWGITSELDLRLLQIPARSDSTDPLVAWAPDRRSAGAGIWLREGILLADHPQRALLGGRSLEHAGLIADLEGAHRARYRRSDGSWGGWHHQLAVWKIDVLLIPVELQSLNRALHRSTWKALDIDSPTIPFGSADDPQFSSAILETLQQQGFVESGPWQPTEEIYEGPGWRLDLADSAGLGPDPMPAIRQSLLFRAMDIPTASLRALRPIRQQVHHRALTAEFLQCQRDLCYQEWSDFGTASFLRRLILKKLTATSSGDPNPPWAMIEPEEELGAASSWNRCLDLYLTGELPDSIQALQASTSEQYFAAAMIRMELGQSSEAVVALQQVIARNDNPSLLLAARYWLKQLESFNAR